MRLTWHVSGKHNDDSAVQDGTIEELKGAVHAVCRLPENTVLTDVRGEILIDAAKTEKIFMNGYQTWTWSPEYSKEDKIRGLHGIPENLISKYSFDRYGDYHFVPYLNRSGILHGESWCYFRIGSKFRLFASLDERPGYTLFTYDAKLGCLCLKRDCTDVMVSGDFHAFDLFYAEGTEEEVFNAWFDAMNIQPRSAEKLHGYSSWYNRYQNISEESLSKDLKGCRELFEPGDLFQIDDGFESSVGDWLVPDKDKFPNGMKAMADQIHEAGFKAGLWLAPFAAEEKSEIYQKHPEWLLKINGKPWKCGCNWSGFYALDIDNEEVQKYLSEVFKQVFEEWKYDLVKLDFLYAAAPFGTENESRAGRMYRAMEFLRKICGTHPIIGCGVPVMPSFGLVEYCRISCDVTLDFDDSMIMRMTHRERNSTMHAMNNIVTRRELNHRAYISDPDVFFLRTKNCRLTSEQKIQLASMDALLGGVFLTSDDPGTYTDEMKRQYKELRHLTEADQVHVRDTDGGTVISYHLDEEDHEILI